MKNLTWEEISEEEPRLLRLYHLAKMVGDRGGKYFCANLIWYELFKPQLLTLVGYHAEGNHPTLHSSEAYDLAYHHIYDELPNCRDCLCG